MLVLTLRQHQLPVRTGCRPTIIDSKCQPLASDTPEMIATLAIWTQSSLAERQAYHRVICLKSRDDADMAAYQALSGTITAPSRGDFYSGNLTSCRMTLQLCRAAWSIRRSKTEALLASSIFGLTLPSKNGSPVQIRLAAPSGMRSVMWV